MSKEIEEIIQEDIDEICTFGHYSVATAYNTLISARDKIKELQKEVERLEDNEVILADEVIRLEQENTKLKEQVKELKGDSDLAYNLLNEEMRKKMFPNGRKKFSL